MVLYSGSVDLFAVSASHRFRLIGLKAGGVHIAAQIVWLLTDDLCEGWLTGVDVCKIERQKRPNFYTGSRAFDIQEWAGK